MQFCAGGARHRQIEIERELGLLFSIFFWQMPNPATAAAEASLEVGGVLDLARSTGVHVGRMLTSSLVLYMSSAYLCIMASFAFDSLALHIPLEIYLHVGLLVQLPNSHDVLLGKATTTTIIIIIIIIIIITICCVVVASTLVHTFLQGCHNLFHVLLLFPSQE